MSTRFVSFARCVRVARNGELFGEEIREDLIGRASPVAAGYDHLPALPDDGRVAVEALLVGKSVVSVGGMLDESLQRCIHSVCFIRDSL